MTTKPPLKPLGDRVLIQADREEHAPEVLDSGLVVAKTLASAVEGSDAEDSWFVGTIIAVGPLVNVIDCRNMVLKRLKAIYSVRDIQRLIEDLERQLPDCPEPLKVGDRVTFSWASGQQITVDGERFLIMSASDVLAILESERVA